jgi:hypothetical protein
MIELQIQTNFEARGSQAPSYPRLHLPVQGQGQAEMLLDVDKSLDMERATAFELGRAPSPPLAKFRIDSDHNFSTNSCSDVIKSRASIYFFLKLQFDCCKGQVKVSFTA